MPTLDSVPGGASPVGNQQQAGTAGDIKKSGSVGLGYEQGNTVSQQSDIRQPSPLSPPAGKPVLDHPEANALALAAQAVREAPPYSDIAATSADLSFGVQNLHTNHPAIHDTPGFMDRFQKIQGKLQTLEDISPQALGDIRHHAQNFKALTSQPTLDPDKLETILSQIESKLGDQSAKYNETKLEIAAQDKIQESNERISALREHMEGDRKDYSALKILAFIFFPILAIKAAIVAGTDKDYGTSLIISLEANQKAFNFFKNIFGWKGPEAKGSSGPVDNPSAPRGDQPVNNDGEIDFTTEGPSLAEDGLRHSDFLKMLMKAQADEESKEKLEQAIDTLQSGDPKAAAEILDSISGSVTFEAGKGNNTIADDFRGMVDYYLSEHSEQSVNSDYSEMIDDFSDVSEDTRQQVETASLQEAMIARKNSV